MDRYCVCGKKIWKDKTLCVDCMHKYGLDREAWPEWLRDWAKSIQKEMNYENRHRHYPIIDEVDKKRPFVSGDAYSNLIRAQANSEMDFEDFIWDNV